MTKRLWLLLLVVGCSPVPGDTGRPPDEPQSAAAGTWHGTFFGAPVELQLQPDHRVQLDWGSSRQFGTWDDKKISVRHFLTTGINEEKYEVHGSEIYLTPLNDKGVPVDVDNVMVLRRGPAPKDK